MAELDISRSSPTLAVLALALGIAAIGSNSLLLSPILSEVAASLGATPVRISWASAAYGGATALSAFLLAPRIDRLGLRRAVLLGLAALIAATAGSALAPHWLWLIAAQALAGLGAGIALPATYALASVVAPPGQEAKTLGRVLTGWAVSLVAGIPVAAFIADQLGWRAAFVTVALAAACAVMGVAGLPAGAVAPAARRTGVLAPLRFAGVPRLLMVCLGFMGAFYGVYAFLGDHVRGLLGLTTAQTGLIVLVYGLGFGLASLGDGLVDRFGPRRIFPVAMLGVGILYAAMVPGVQHFAVIAVIAGLWGFCNHFGLNIMVLLLVQARPDERGAVLGLNSAVTYLASLAGVALSGLVYDQAGFGPLALGAAAVMVGVAALAVSASAR
jgi:predicted MFS family arabinose efflux permease